MATAPPPIPGNLPLDNRSNELRIPMVTLIVFSSIFVILRLGVSIRNRNYFLLTDILLWTGHIIAIAGAVCCYKTADHGGGRHVWEPFMTPANLTNYMYYLWWSQLLNLYGMALVKLSICAYIFMLNFSKGFRILIWASVFVHISLNFIFPSVILFGECTPISKHWDILGTHSGSCWTDRYKVASGYSGAATNILTDLIYTVAPLVYISLVQLNTRTIWGVRIVFLLGLITTTISALKLYEMKSLRSSPDPTYTSVNLSIFASAEVFIGVFTACLPPLRKTIDNLLQKVLPSGMLSSQASGNSYGLKIWSKRFSKRFSSLHKETMPHATHDGDSKCEIMPGVPIGRHESQDEIVKTTLVSVTVDDGASSQHRKDDWV